MGLHLVSAGRNVPDEINVIIEIPKDAEIGRASCRERV